MEGARGAARDGGGGAQARAIARATKELKLKLTQLIQQEDLLQARTEQLALQQRAVDQHLEIERAKIVVQAEGVAAELGAEAEGARRQLREVTEHNVELQQRADAMRDRQAQAELEASVWRNAHSAASARALGLESEKGQLAAALQAEKARAEALAEAQKKLQRKRQAEQRGAAAEGGVHRGRRRRAAAAPR